MTFLLDEPDFESGSAPGWAAPVPDDVELVTEVSRMMSVFAAERFERNERRLKSRLGSVKLLAPSVMVRVPFGPGVTCVPVPAAPYTRMTLLRAADSSPKS